MREVGRGYALGGILEGLFFGVGGGLRVCMGGPFGVCNFLFLYHHLSEVTNPFS